MKRFAILICLVVTLQVSAQDYQKEINEQVWKPFITTFGNRDTPGFMAVHSKDLVRAPRDSKSISNYDEYRKNNEAGDKRSKESNTTRSIDLRFLERIASSQQAYEVGIYRVTVERPGQGPQHYYGKFHVVHRKENGTWKILVDSDSSEGGTINEKSFLEAQPME